MLHYAASDLGLHCLPIPSLSFTDNQLYKALWHHSDKNRAAIHDHYLDVVQTRGLISLVNNNHMDNHLKEIGFCMLWLNCKQTAPKKTERNQPPTNVKI